MGSIATFLADNIINGGMLTLRDAIRGCGGDQNIRCLADRYNGSTEAQRRRWTADVAQRLASLNQRGQATPPAAMARPNASWGRGISRQGARRWRRRPPPRL